MVRSCARTLGINRFLHDIMYSKQYEDLFAQALLGGIKHGDCVWDVGGNVGYYSKKFAACVLSTGSVVAFEPSPVNLVILRDAVKDIPQVIVEPIALGSFKGIIRFQQGVDVEGSTSKCLEAGDTSDPNNVFKVQIMRGDELVRMGKIPVPNVVKIDTEGYELDVLQGCEGFLKNPALRIFGIEVHFGVLNERGQADAPRGMESMLSNAGFKVTWTDASHLIATRLGDQD